MKTNIDGILDILKRNNVLLDRIKEESKDLENISNDINNCIKELTRIKETELRIPRRKINWTEEMLKEKLDEIYLEKGHLPKIEDLFLYGLESPLKKFGGYKKISKKYGYVTYKELYGTNVENKIKWTEEKLKEKLDCIVEEKGYLPKHQVLQDQYRLASAINTFGGYKHLVQKYGYISEIKNRKNNK